MQCIAGLVGQTVREKAGPGKPDRLTVCDAHGESLAKAVVPGGNQSHHHDAVNQAISWVCQTAGISASMEVTDHFTTVASSEIVQPLLPLSSLSTANS